MLRHPGRKHVDTQKLRNQVAIMQNTTPLILGVSTRCHMAALEAGNMLSSLLPRRSPHWLPMLEDIVTAPILVDKMEKMNKVLMDQDEWHYISMDATLKLIMHEADGASLIPSATIGPQRSPFRGRRCMETTPYH